MRNSMVISKFDFDKVITSRNGPQGFGIPIFDLKLSRDPA